jgi:hypothetical protein
MRSVISAFLTLFSRIETSSRVESSQANIRLLGSRMSSYLQNVVVCLKVRLEALLVLLGKVEEVDVDPAAGG